MQPGRLPISTRTRLYGIVADSIGQRPMLVPALFNALLERRGVDAIFVPFQVTAEHVAAAIAGMRHLRNFAGFAVTMPHKAAVAQLCDTLLPHAQACGVVNTVRIAPDGRLIGETFDGVGMVQAITPHQGEQRPGVLANSVSRAYRYAADAYERLQCMPRVSAASRLRCSPVRT